MSIDHPVRPSFASALTRRAAHGEAAASIVRSLVLVLQDLEATLEPSFGPRGTAALIERSVRRAGIRHPILRPLDLQLPTPVDAPRWSRALATADAVQIAAAAGDLFAALHARLESLLGDGLTVPLLGPVWTALIDERPSHRTPS